MDIPNLHPPLTSFPVVLFVLSLLIEAVQLYVKDQRLHVITSALVVLAAVFTVFTYFSGYHGMQFVTEAQLLRAEEELALHQLLGKLLLFLSVFTAAFKFTHDSTAPVISIFQLAYLVALLITTACVVYTSSIGGSLVYDFGFAVKS